jgi:hypothetical protein
VNLFLDSSVVLPACASATGASSEVCRRAASHGWSLITTPYVITEIEANLSDLKPAARTAWQALKPQLQMRDDIFTIDRRSSRKICSAIS